MKVIRRLPRSVLAAAALLAVLALPPVSDALHARMQLQMLIDVPLLVAAGWLLRGALPRRARDALGAWNANGVTGALLASFVLALWMLPRAMDAATTEPLARAAQLASLPLLAGLPLGLAWPRMNFVARGVAMSELIAMCFRLGWLYLASPVQLCSSYMVDDQRRYGLTLLMLGAALVAWIAYKLLFGRFAVLSAPDARAAAAFPRKTRRSPS